MAARGRPSTRAGAGLPPAHGASGRPATGGTAVGAGGAGGRRAGGAGGATASTPTLHHSGSAAAAGAAGANNSSSTPWDAPSLDDAFARSVTESLLGTHGFGSSHNLRQAAAHGAAATTPFSPIRQQGRPDDINTQQEPSSPSHMSRSRSPSPSPSRRHGSPKSPGSRTGRPYSPNSSALGAERSMWTRRPPEGDGLLVEFDEAEQLQFSKRVRENASSFGRGQRFKNGRPNGYTSEFLLDKPLNSVGPQIRSDWVSPGSISFGSCTRLDKNKPYAQEVNGAVSPASYNVAAGLGEQVLSIRRSPSNATFGESVRVGENYHGRSPGPAYLVPSDIGGKYGPKFSFGTAPLGSIYKATDSPGPKYMVDVKQLKHITGQGSSPNFSFGVAKRKTMTFIQCSPGPVYQIPDAFARKRKGQKGFSFGAAERKPFL